ncbi:hypothetical protein BG000_000846 [Podila horticola]|nr:hypothetical protein BG000_000846 [Podila horticola]
MENPLNLPEIIHQVGWHLARWTKSEKLYRRFDFDSSDLIACINLNRTWHRTLTPILWMIYEESQNTQWKVPIDTLRTQSHHFRYLSLYNIYPEGVINSTRLRELYANATAKGSIAHVVRSNPDLLSLTLWLGDLNFNDVYPALSTLSRLQYLKLAHFRFNNDDQVIALLNNNPGLRKIYFWSVEGITGLDGCKPLLYVTKVSMQPEWESTPGLVQILKFCPNLENLDLYVPDRSFPIADLTMNLREFCPKLRSLRCSECDEDNSYDVVLEDDEIANLLNVSPGLILIDINRRTIRPRVAQALLAHAKWLETLELVFHRGDKRNVCFVNKVLANCPNLRTLAIGNAFTAEYHPLKLSWFNKLPWNCPLLQDIQLRGFTDNCYRLSGDILSDAESEAGDSEASSEDDEHFHNDHFNFGSASSESDSDDNEPPHSAHATTELFTNQALVSEPFDGDSDNNEALHSVSVSAESLERGSSTDHLANEEHMHSESLDNDLSDNKTLDYQSSEDNSTESDQLWTQKTAPTRQAQDRRAKLARGHEEVDRLFLAEIESKGWTAEWHSGSKYHVTPISQPARMIRDMIFGYVGDSPHIRRIAVENFEYVRKDIMSRD